MEHESDAEETSERTLIWSDLDIHWKRSATKTAVSNALSTVNKIREQVRNDVAATKEQLINGHCLGIT